MRTVMSKLIEKSDSAYSNWGINIIFVNKKGQIKNTFLVNKSNEGIFSIFEFFYSNFGTLGIEIAKIRFQIRTRSP